ncbi:MAG: hypothetical protein K1X56_01295 [Flavobacteriales bacterium]|nr:hypothetical protein [Flavobacteriales bacterium]
MRIFLFILIIALESCSVKYSFTGADIPQEAKTVSVAFFQNNAALAGPNVPQLFTESLKDIFISQTKLNLVRQNGDLQFEGAITGYDVRPMAIQGNDAAALNRLTMTVNVRYVNQFDSKKNFEQNFTRFVDFPSTTDLTSNEESLVGEVNRQLVQDIFDRSFGNW